jgi:hypothetical protein
MYSEKKMENPAQFLENFLQSYVLYCILFYFGFYLFYLLIFLFCFFYRFMLSYHTKSLGPMTFGPMVVAILLRTDYHFEMSREPLGIRFTLAVHCHFHTVDTFLCVPSFRHDVA